MTTQYTNITSFFEILYETEGPHGTTLYLLDRKRGNNDRLYLAYKGEEYEGQGDSSYLTISISDFLKTKSGDSYPTRPFKCLCCGKRDSQLKSTTESYDLAACRDCHDLLREQFDQIIEENKHNNIVSRLI